MRLASLLGPDLKQLLKEDPDQVRELLDEIHPEDLADIVGELDPDEAGELLARLPAEDAAPIFERLDEHEQEELVEQMPPESVAEIASEMAADDRADLFSLLPEAVGEQLFEALEKVDPEAAQEVRDIEKWPETQRRPPDDDRLRPRLAADARAPRRSRSSRKRAESTRSSSTSSTSIDQERLDGRRSACASSSSRTRRSRIAEIMRTNILSVPPTMDQEDVARQMAKYDLNVMPVVDRGRQAPRRHHDRRHHRRPRPGADGGRAEARRRRAARRAVLPDEFLTFIKKRAGWLIILFVEEFFTQTALRYYDPVMEAVKGALLYVPLLISAGGNSGSQSSTLVIRGLALGEIKLKDWWRILVRELAMGLVLGIMHRVPSRWVACMMYPDQTFRFALTVGITVLCIIVAGCTVGSMLPIILKRLGIDPATSSTPFIASLVDTLGRHHLRARGDGGDERRDHRGAGPRPGPVALRPAARARTRRTSRRASPAPGPPSRRTRTPIRRRATGCRRRSRGPARRA